MNKMQFVLALIAICTLTSIYPSIVAPNGNGFLDFSTESNISEENEGEDDKLKTVLSCCPVNTNRVVCTKAEQRKCKEVNQKECVVPQKVSCVKPRVTATDCNNK